MRCYLYRTSILTWDSEEDSSSHFPYRSLEKLCHLFAVHFAFLGICSNLPDISLIHLYLHTMYSCTQKPDCLCHRRSEALSIQLPIQNQVSDVCGRNRCIISIPLTILSCNNMNVSILQARSCPKYCQSRTEPAYSRPLCCFAST